MWKPCGLWSTTAPCPKLSRIAYPTSAAIALYTVLIAFVRIYSTLCVSREAILEAVSMLTNTLRNLYFPVTSSDSRSRIRYRVRDKVSCEILWMTKKHSMASLGQLTDEMHFEKIIMFYHKDLQRSSYPSCDSARADIYGIKTLHLILVI
jgi:hypothetical protein